MSSPRAIRIALLAMGGEGGGVLADWLVDLAEANGFLAQSTSVPGVAQRTGATIYYIEMFAESDVPQGAQPVFALSPVPGDVDVVIASELMEAGRALQRGLVTPDRTTFIASSHRVYSMTERTAMGDGRVDSRKLLEGGRAAAKRFIGADFGQVAQRTGSLIGPALYGALAASGALPFGRDQFEETIRRGGVGVQASLAAFAAGFDAANTQPAVVDEAEAKKAPAPSVGPRLAPLAQRIGTEFPHSAHAVLIAGILRLADYQDVDYAAEYLDRLNGLRSADATLLAETARHLALWMSYEDTVRVADLKTRRSRFDRVQDEVRLAPAQQLEIREFMHPRIDEIADTLPARIGRWLLETRWARGLVEPFTRNGRIVHTTSLSGYLLLYAIASLRGVRRKSLRHSVERQRIDAWLALVERLSVARPALALEVAKLQRLVKGYGQTHARGWNNFERLIALVPGLEQRDDGARRLKDLTQAALSDESGEALERQLATATA